MALFVHLTPEKNLRSIRRNGIKPTRLRRPLREGFERAVFAMPVTADFYASHQWLRELKRSGQRTIVAVYFRIPDREDVLLGRYNKDHEHCQAVEALGRIYNSSQSEGYEALIPRRIMSSEIQSTRALPQVLGWRYYPEAKGRKPCGCPYCSKGDIKSKRIRQNAADRP